MNAPADPMRPFHFIVVVWGERFRSYLTDWCLPSLLSPGNIPALPKGLPHKFLVATTPEDWEELRSHAIMRRLAQYVEPVLVPIPPAPPGVSGCEHMGIGHKLGTGIAHRAGAFGFLLTPDFILTDGAIAALVEHARNGKHVVMTAALRFAEEPLFDQFRQAGLFNHDPAEGLPVAVPPRVMARIAPRALHSETLSYEFEKPYYADFPIGSIWPVPDQDAIVVHSLSWGPVLLDYGVLESHDDSTMDNWTIDGDYVHKNFASTDSLHVVTDSDELMMVSWAPLGDRPRDMSPRFLKGRHALGAWYRRHLLRSAFHDSVFDPLKRRIFMQPVIWHGNEISMPVQKMAEHAQQTIQTALSASPASILAFKTIAMARRLTVPIYFIRRLIQLLWGAVSGDMASRQRLLRRLRLVLAGRPLAP